MKRFVSILCILCLAFTLCEWRGQNVTKVNAADLSVPANVGWKEGALATAEWDAVEGADYYTVIVRVLSDGNNLGETEAGTSETETDLQQQIRSLAAEVNGQVEVSFKVQAKNTQSNTEGEFSSYSDTLIYRLNANEELEAPTEVSLSDEGVLRFKPVDGADHYLVGNNVSGSAIGYAGDVAIDDVEVVEGYYCYDMSDSMRFYYLDRDYLGETVVFSVWVKAVFPDGRESEATLANTINYLIEPDLPAPEFVSLDKEEDHYWFKFRNSALGDDWYIELQIYMDSYTERESGERIKWDSQNSREKPYNLALRYDTNNISFYDFGEGIYGIDILNLLKYYVYQEYEVNADNPIDIGVRVRNREDEKISYYSTMYIVKDFKEPALLGEVNDPVIKTENGRYIVSFTPVDGALGYQVRFHVFGEYFRSENSYDYEIDEFTFEDGKCFIDVTDRYLEQIQPLSRELGDAFFSATIRAYGEQGNNYDFVGPYSENTNQLMVYPVGKPVDSLTLSPANPILAVGNSLYLGKTVKPEDGYYVNTEWTSDDEDIVTVSNDGRITGVSEGRAEITVTVDGPVSASVTVNTYVVHSNIEDEDEAETVKEMSGTIIDDIGNKDEPDLSGTDISTENLDELREELHRAVENGDSFHTDINTIQQQFDEYENNWEQIQAAAGELNTRFAGAYEIEVEMCHKDAQTGEEHHIGNITELENEITFTIEIEGDASDYVLVRVHKNAEGEEEYEQINCTVNDDGTLTARSDKFSSFIILSTEAVNGNGSGNGSGSGSGSGTTTGGTISGGTSTPIETVQTEDVPVANTSEDSEKEPVQEEKTKGDERTEIEEQSAIAEEQAEKVFENVEVEATVADPNEAVSATIKKGIYVDEEGKPITDGFIKTKKGNTLYLDDKGNVVKSAIVVAVNPETGESTMLYMKKNGAVAKDAVIKLKSGDKIYAGEDGTIITDKLITSKTGYSYYAEGSGLIAKNKVVKTDDGRLFANKYGHIVKNKLVTAPSGKKYYATENGTLATSCWITVKGVEYWCNKKGIITKSRKAK